MLMSATSTISSTAFLRGNKARNRAKPTIFLKIQINNSKFRRQDAVPAGSRRTVKAYVRTEVWLDVSVMSSLPAGTRSPSRSDRCFPGKKLRYPFDRILDRPQSQSRGWGIEKKLLLVPYGTRIVCGTALHPQHCIGKAIPLQAWTGPESSRRLRLPDFKTIGTWRW